MVFTPEHDAFILMAHYRSGMQDANGSWVYSLQSCMEQFNQRFPDFNVDYDSLKRRKHVIVTRFEERNCICKQKAGGRITKLNHEVVEDIRERMDRSPHKSMRKLASETGLSVGTCYKAVSKKLQMYPYKVTLVQRLQPLDYDRRVTFCHWFNQNLNDNNMLDITFFSDEAWFHLSGYVNSQNYRTWATDNPHQFVETDLHPIKVGIWVAMSRRRIIGPIFFYDTITGARYREILGTFIDQLHDDELQHGFFQQDNAPPHTARETQQYLTEYFAERLISTNLWPPRSPDLTPLDFYMFGNLKNKVYKNRPQNLQQLEAAIQEEINNITEQELQRVFDNLQRRVNICLQNNGQHFQHLL